MNKTTKKNLVAAITFIIAFLVAYGYVWMFIESESADTSKFTLSGFKLMLLVALVFGLISYIISEIILKEEPIRPIPIPSQFSLIKSSRDLRQAMNRIVDNSEKYLFMTGSRGNNVQYFSKIESKVTSMPSLIFHRILIGNPSHQSFKEHLVKLVKIRKPNDKIEGVKTMNLANHSDLKKEPEKFILGNEKQVLIILPSLNNIGNLDTALNIVDQELVGKYRDYVVKLYNSAKEYENLNQIQALQVI